MGEEWGTTPSGMTAEQEERLFRILGHKLDSAPVLPPYPERVALLLAVLVGNAEQFHELYARGGQHPKDLDKARLCEGLAVVVATLFPEVE